MRKSIGLLAAALVLRATPGIDGAAAADSARPAPDYPAAECTKPDDNFAKLGKPRYRYSASGANTGPMIDSGAVGSYNSLAKAYNRNAQSYNSCISGYVAAANGEIKRLQDEAAAQIKLTADQANARIKGIEKQIQGVVDEANGVGTASAASGAESPSKCKKPQKLAPGRRTVAQTTKYDQEERAYRPCVASYIAGATAEIHEIQSKANGDTKQITEAANDRIRLINSRMHDATGETAHATSAAPSGGDEPPQGAPLESVTVTASKPSTAAINSFIFSHATPTRLTGKLARWKTGICPVAFGLEPKFAAYVTQRIRDVAASVGAPVNRDASCKDNIRIIFTPTPQELLDTIRVEHAAFLGYYDNPAQAVRLATVTHPIQSWYVTATADLRGHLEVDNSRPGGVMLDMPVAPFAYGGIAVPMSTMTMNMPNASIKNVTGNRLGDGLSSEFTYITIVAEPAKLLDFEIGTLADYIAMLALSQLESLDGCEALPSITNLLSPGCTTIARTITDGDLAYLRGLYKMIPAGSLQMQRNEVRYQMEQALKPQDDRQ